MAAEVISLFALTRWGGPDLVFVEHYDRGGSDGPEDPDEFALVVFSHHDVLPTMRSGVSRRTIGEPSWSHLNRATVEGLVGHRV